MRTSKTKKEKNCKGWLKSGNTTKFWRTSVSQHSVMYHFCDWNWDMCDDNLQIFLRIKTLAGERVVECQFKVTSLWNSCQY